MDLSGAQNPSAHKSGSTVAHASQQFPKIDDNEEAESLYARGMLLHSKGETLPALELLAKAEAEDPTGAHIKIGYAAALCAGGHYAKALDILKQAMQLDDQIAVTHVNLGLVLNRLDRPAEAVASFQRAVIIDPNCFAGLIHLAKSLRVGGQFAEAAKALDRAKLLRPADADVLRELAAISADRGDVQRMLTFHARLVRSNAVTAVDFSALVLSTHYNPLVTRQVFLKGAKAWASRYAEPLTRVASPPQRDRHPSRRLRVGYISSDLREHPAGRLIAPVLASHNRRLFECFCYSDVPPGGRDKLTAHLQGLADVWRETHGLTDEQVKEMTEHDQIDLLVELNGHFGNHRLSLLARRAAPVQISAFGYCDTTGLSAVDYRLTDSASDPPGASDKFHTEKLLRFEGSCWCYQPWDRTPQVQPPPTLANHVITFGNLNNPVKTNARVARVWAEILNRVPGSRLLLLTPHGAEEHIAKRFAKLGIHLDRVLLASPAPRLAYINVYHKIDIALDPFPFNGDNTTCDAMWMGVPVVSLLGEAFWSRRGFSHLTAVGLEHLVAKTEQRYIDIAVNLAKNVDKLVELRRSLRSRLIQSSLGDSASYVLKLEAVYRQVWTYWCSSPAVPIQGS